MGASDLAIVPNPFSPLVLASRDGNTEYGTRIHFRPESAKSAYVTVSIHIFNMAGELTRILVNHRTVPKAPVDFYWDGRTDEGAWARNGRYLVKLTLQETGGRGVTHILKHVVVFR